MAASTSLGAALGGGEVTRRRQPRRRAHQPGEHGRFGKRYLARGLAEVALRGLLDAIGAGAEIDAIEIERENLRLGIFPFQPDRQQHFLQLAIDGALLREEEVLRQLLRDGGAALADAAVQDVGDERARNAERVDAIVRIEAPVFDGDEGLRHIRRQFFQRQHRAGAVAAGGERAAAEIDDLDRRRPLGDFQRLDRRQMRADTDHRADARDAKPEREYDAPVGEATDERTCGARRASICAFASSRAWPAACRRPDGRLQTRAGPGCCCPTPARAACAIFCVPTP